MREPPEPLDYVSVPCCVRGYVGTPPARGQAVRKGRRSGVGPPFSLCMNGMYKNILWKAGSSLSSACSTAYLEDSSAAPSAAWVRPSPRNMLRGNWSSTMTSARQLLASSRQPSRSPAAASS